MGDIPGMDENGVLLTRLAVMYHGGNPADDSEIVKHLTGSGKKHARFIDPVLAQNTSNLSTKYFYDDAGDVEYVMVGDYKLRALTGNDRMMVDGKMEVWDTLKRLSSVTESELEELPYGVVNSMALVVLFLVADVLMEVNTQE